MFTVEQAPDDAAGGFRLNPHGRYSHAEAYLRRTLAAAGFAEPLIDRVILRQELKVPVAGYLVTARLRNGAVANRAVTRLRGRRSPGPGRPCGCRGQRNSS